MSQFTFKELRAEYDRAKALYLAKPDYTNGMYFNALAAELDRRISNGETS